MPTGIIINVLSVAIGGLVGTVAGHKLSLDFKENLNMIFGVCAMTMGIGSIVLMENMPAVIFSVVVGTAIGLAELGIDSIPLNALMPIPGTPLEHLPRLTEPEILRTIAFFRYINPEANIRLAAGRALLTHDGETAFRAGASATITGNMLTTVACATIRSDRKMLTDMGRDVTPPWEVSYE